MATLDEVTGATTTMLMSMAVVIMLVPAETVVDSMVGAITFSGTSAAPKAVAFVTVLSNGGNVDIGVVCAQRANAGAKCGGVCAWKDGGGDECYSYGKRARQLYVAEIMFVAMAWQHHCPSMRWWQQ